MGKHKDYLCYEGRIHAVLAHRSEQTVLGSTWRFVMDDNKTLVVLPFQTRHSVPVHPGIVPQEVSSALSDLAVLAFTVQGAYGPQAGTAAYKEIPLLEWGSYAAGRFAKHDKVAEKAAIRIIQAYNARWHGKPIRIAGVKAIRDVLFDIALRNNIRAVDEVRVA